MKVIQKIVLIVAVVALFFGITPRVKKESDSEDDSMDGESVFVVNDTKASFFIL